VEAHLPRIARRRRLAGAEAGVIIVVVPSGAFLGLAGQTLSIDMKDYPIGEIDRILGILMFMTSPPGGRG
jgi:hypothetical protein